MPRELKFDVRGMTCDNCVQHVTKALRGVPGVAGVTVSLEAGAATVHGDFDETAVIEAIEEEGYEAELQPA